jgi:sugar lactone lactonase YvrE
VADIDELVAVDITKGEITKRYPAKDAVFLNDVATDKDGRVFVSDSGTNTIWVLDNGNFSIWLADPKLKSPNGLLVEGDKLIVAGFGTLPDDKQKGASANLIQVSLTDKSIRSLGDATPVGNLDGLESDGNGDYLVTDWFGGVLYRIKPSGKFERLIDFAQGSADLHYFPATKTAVIPLMLESKIVAYKLD